MQRSTVDQHTNAAKIDGWVTLLWGMGAVQCSGWAGVRMVCLQVASFVDRECSIESARCLAAGHVTEISMDNFQWLGFGKASPCGGLFWSFSVARVVLDCESGNVVACDLSGALGDASSRRRASLRPSRASRSPGYVQPQATARNISVTVSGRYASSLWSRCGRGDVVSERSVSGGHPSPSVGIQVRDGEDGR